jgi:hypothetical protein
VLGSPLRDNELIAYLLAGLNEEYNHVFTTVVAWVEPISPSDLYAQLLSFEQHMHLHAPAALGHSSSAMMASHGHHFPCHGTGRGQIRGLGRGHSSRGRGCSSSRPRP